MIPLTVVAKTILERVERGDAGMDRHLELEPNRGSAKAGAELCDEVMNAPGPSGGPLKDEENLLGQHLYRTFDLFLPCVPSTRRAAACTCASVCIMSCTKNSLGSFECARVLNEGTF